jgi:hypothetical protein
LPAGSGARAALVAGRLGDRAALRNQELIGEAGAYPVLRN